MNYSVFDMDEASKMQARPQSRFAHAATAAAELEKNLHISQMDPEQREALASILAKKASNLKLDQVNLPTHRETVLATERRCCAICDRPLVMEHRLASLCGACGFLRLVVEKWRELGSLEVRQVNMKIPEMRALGLCRQQSGEVLCDYLASAFFEAAAREAETPAKPNEPKTPSPDPRFSDVGRDVLASLFDARFLSIAEEITREPSGGDVCPDH